MYDENKEIYKIQKRKTICIQLSLPKMKTLLTFQNPGTWRWKFPKIKGFNFNLQKINVIDIV